MSESLYEIEVKALNKIFVINGKPVRSPFKLILEESEARRIITAVKSLGLSEYTMIEVSKKLRTNIETITIKKNEPEIDNLVEEEQSIENVIQVIKSYKLTEDIPNKIDGLTDKANEIKNKMNNNYEN